MSKYNLDEMILLNSTEANQEQEQNQNTNESIEVEFQGWEQFGKSFEYMGAGMAGIFIVITIIIVSISLLNKIKPKDKKESE